MPLKRLTETELLKQFNRFHAPESGLRALAELYARDETIFLGETRSSAGPVKLVEVV